jgi:hypothetical protein
MNQITDKIRFIILNFGTFKNHDIDADYSLTVPSPGNLIHCIEGYFLQGVDVEVFESGGNSEVDTYTLDYDELPEDVLNEILIRCKKWEELNQEDLSTYRITYRMETYVKAKDEADAIVAFQNGNGTTPEFIERVSIECED